MKCPSIKCPSMKCLSMKCPMKCPSMKCPTMKCPSMKCPNTKNTFIMFFSFILSFVKPIWFNFVHFFILTTSLFIVDTLLIINKIVL